jgi:hypothetical protein
MNKNNLPRFELFALIAGECVAAAICVGVYILIGKFSFPVVWGLLLGIAVTLANFIILSVTTGRAIDRVMARRPEGEMDEEAAAEFSAKNQAELQNAVRKSFIIRNILMIGTLVLAFLLKDCFNVLATVIPLLLYSPILSFVGLLKRRYEK